MEFETLKKSHLKRNIIMGVVVVLIISAIILTFTRAKYQTTQSIPLVNGTINYSLADLNIIGLYINGKAAEELDSNKTYTLDTIQSTCIYRDGTEIGNLNISYDSETGGLSISPYTAKGTKCTLYFNEQVLVKDTLLANYPTQLTRTDFSTIVTNTTTGTIYYADTSKGRTYYFAGNPTDNWVRFGGFYWRIIRINEDGSLRLIYQGTVANTTGSVTQLSSTSAFNTTYTDNMYVGLKYTSGSVHGLGTNSTILTALNNWYSSNLASYANSIDGNVGFCGDRTPSTSYISSNGSGGTGTTTTYYGAYVRLVTNKTPTFDCPSEDLYTTSGDSNGNKSLTYPIGLISADEVAYAGGVNGTANSSYYLYTSQVYWTMSPYYFYAASSYANVFAVNSDGSFDYSGVSNTYGVRPVINLKSSVQITGGDGSSSNPYVISS